MKSANLRLAQKLVKEMLPEPKPVPDMTGWTSMERFLWKEEQVGLVKLHDEAAEQATYGQPTPREVWLAEHARDEAIKAARKAKVAAERLTRYPGSAAAQIEARATRAEAERLAKVAEEAERVAEEAKLRPPPPPDDEPEATASVAEGGAEPATVESVPPPPAVPEPSPPPEPKPEPQWWEEKARWRERGPADHYEEDTVYECEHEYDPLADGDEEDPDEVVAY